MLYISDTFGTITLGGCSTATINSSNSINSNIDVSGSTITTVASTISTALSSCAQSQEKSNLAMRQAYIESLTDDELAKMTNVINEELNISKIKTK